MATELQSVSNSAPTPMPAAAPGTAGSAAAGAAQPVQARPVQAAPAVAEKADLQFDASELRSRVEEAIDRLNEQMAANGRDLRFSIDSRLDRTIVTVRSSVSGEIVRQIPDDAMLRVARSIEDLKGVLYNEVV